MAFERGLLDPESSLSDAPVRFSDGYTPRNFDRQHAESVTVREALARSLNVPAVEVLRRVGVSAALARLRALGLSSLTGSAAEHGAAIAVGGVEVPLIQLVEAYAALARLGQHRPLSFREDEPPAPAVSRLEPWACAEVLGILEQSGWDAADRQSRMALPRAALKTGTSFGLRDAWAMAATPRWVVGVWFGNFDGSASAVLVGGQTAAPAALLLLRSLEERRPGPWFDAPPRPRSRVSAAPLPDSPGVVDAPGVVNVRWLSLSTARPTCATISRAARRSPCARKSTEADASPTLSRASSSARRSRAKPFAGLFAPANIASHSRSPAAGL